ncbi:hypothetical protein BaRGS_00011609 [Batillaria attramentaria]|uniref:EGF-like domain-containing protein n=1 Tax=Batillaria attramentaria TaxID=370345 RepID=A0ABD0LDK7_9CAEN
MFIPVLTPSFTLQCIGSYEPTNWLQSVNYSITVVDIDNCVDNLCQNGATCADQVNGYGCICKPGYTSWLCEEDVDECASNPCRNGGNCTQHVINGYNCTCAIGFVGDNCEINFDECSTEPCRNGATCENLYNDYRCVCVPGFAGKKCESDVDECASYPCKNGAQCMDLFGDYICTCRIGFKGRHCQFDLRVFLDFRPSPRITYTKYASVDVICCRPPDVDSSEMHELAIYLTQDRLPPKMWLVANMVKTDNGFKTRNVVKFTKSSVIEDEDKMCLTFSMGQATCEDSGLYTCRATYSVHGFAGKQTEERSEELVIQVMPGVVITQVVKKANLFVENENVTFHCNETFPLTYDKPLWRWEMKETPETNWKTYSKADIRVSKPVMVDGCRQWQTTTLTHKIKYPDDNGTMYRCHIFQHGALMGPVGLFTVDKVTSAAKLDVAASKNAGEVTWLSSMKSLGMYLAFGMTVTVAALTVFAYIHHQQTIKNREKEEREQRMWRCRRLPTAYE